MSELDTSTVPLFSRVPVDFSVLPGPTMKVPEFVKPATQTKLLPLVIVKVPALLFRNWMSENCDSAPSKRTSAALLKMLPPLNWSTELLPTSQRPPRSSPLTTLAHVALPVRNVPPLSTRIRPWLLNRIGVERPLFPG